MKRIIVDYKKLTKEILSLLVEKFPGGYGDDDIIKFRNSNNEAIEAVEVSTEDTVYLVKVSTRLAYTMENFYEEDENFNINNPPTQTIEMPDENHDENDPDRR